jgi:hypothetical protein
MQNLSFAGDLEWFTNVWNTAIDFARPPTVPRPQYMALVFSALTSISNPIVFADAVRRTCADETRFLIQDRASNPNAEVPKKAERSRRSQSSRTTAGDHSSVSCKGVLGRGDLEACSGSRAAVHFTRRDQACSCRTGGWAERCPIDRRRPIGCAWSFAGKLSKASPPFAAPTVPLL